MIAQNKSLNSKRHPSKEVPQEDNQIQTHEKNQKKTDETNGDQTHHCSSEVYLPKTHSLGKKLPDLHSIRMQYVSVWNDLHTYEI